jgi:hypothetical protein
MIIFVFQSPVGGLKWERVPCEYETAQECPSTIAYAFFTTMAFILGTLISTLSRKLGMKMQLMQMQGQHLKHAEEFKRPSRLLSSLVQ